MGDIGSKLAGVSIALLIVGGFFWRTYSNHRLYEKVSMLADLNGPNIELRGDGVTDHTEWSQVYKEAGVHYDVNNPKELSISQMKEYIKSHSTD